MDDNPLPSYVKQTGPTTDYWPIEPSGDAAADNRRGREIAAECHGFADRHDNLMIPFRTLKDMIAKGRVGPLEQGFLMDYVERAHVS